MGQDPGVSKKYNCIMNTDVRKLCGKPDPNILEKGE